MADSVIQVGGREDALAKRIDDAGASLAVPPLAAVWSYLQHMQGLHSIAEIHRGIEWNLPLTKDGKETGNRDKLISATPKKGFREGVPPRTPFHAFERPETRRLSVRPEDQRGNAYKLPWDRPKVLLNAIRRSRGPWRMAAYADLEGLVCYQNLVAVWPNDPANAVVLTAFLNGPIANAYVATREERHITNETLASIPVPSLSGEQRRQVEKLVNRYKEAIAAIPLLQPKSGAKADVLLRHIDALVLKAYDLPPRLERELLDYFRGAERTVPFAFADYFPAGFEPCFSLAYYLSSAFQKSTAGELRSRYQLAPEDVLTALDAAVEGYGE